MHKKSIRLPLYLLGIALILVLFTPFTSKEDFLLTAQSAEAPEISPASLTPSPSVSVSISPSPLIAKETPTPVPTKQPAKKESVKSTPVKTPEASSPKQGSPSPIPSKNPVETPTETSPTPKKAASCKSSNFNEEFLCLINKHRAENGKGALAFDVSLNEVALDHSTWMKKNETMSHEGENNSAFYERCEMGGTRCNAENIAYGFTGAEDLFILWKESPGHNKNMLGNYSLMGLGISGKYATNIFR